MQADRNPPSRATLLKYVKIATSFKEAALLAMKDVTYLNTREKGHSDFTFGDARRAAGVSESDGNTTTSSVYSAPRQASA